jgi:hypothetical protein
MTKRVELFESAMVNACRNILANRPRSMPIKWGRVIAEWILILPLIFLILDTIYWIIKAVFF